MDTVCSTRWFLSTAAHGAAYCRQRTGAGRQHSLASVCCNVARMDLEREKPLGERAYEAIKHMIVVGELAPDQAVPESVLAKQLGISRSPVKAALTRLQQEGLVVAEAWKVPLVAPLNGKYVDDVYQLRRALDTLCAEQSIKLIPEEEVAAFELELTALEDEVARGELDNVREANFHFHELLITHCGNDLLRTMMSRLQDHLERVRHASPGDDDDWLAIEYDWLKKEIGAVRVRDSDELVRLLTAHLDAFRTRILAVWPDRESTATTGLVTSR